MAEMENTRESRYKSFFQALRDLNYFLMVVGASVAAIGSYLSDAKLYGAFLLGLTIGVLSGGAAIVLLTYLRYERGVRTKAIDFTGDLAESYGRVRQKHDRIFSDAWLFIQLLRRTTLLILRGR